MFTDIVGSTPLVEAMGDAAWQFLLEWHDRALRTSIEQHHGEEAGHEGDGFFVVFDDVVDAIDCGVDIQRTLADHRRDHGFAPAVRIGVHLADATKNEGGYSGIGVHEAARVGAAASAGEVLVSCASLDGIADRYTVREQRSLTLKGIADPVAVASVVWS
jgi:class 3 adenylate cyclase